MAWSIQNFWMTIRKRLRTQLENEGVINTYQSWPLLGDELWQRCFQVDSSEDKGTQLLKCCEMHWGGTYLVYRDC
jgi:hypothetical protein